MLILILILSTIFITLAIIFVENYLRKRKYEEHREDIRNRILKIIRNKCF